MLAPDLRGHGDSQRGSYGLAHQMADLKGLIEAEGLVQPTIVAHSLGGQIAAQFAGTFPDVVSRMVLVESIGPPRASHHGPEAWQAIMRQRVNLAAAPTRQRVMPDLADAQERFGRANPHLDSGLRDFVVMKNTRDADGGVVWKFDPRTREWLLLHDHTRAEDLWSGVTCPVRVVLGADSWERFWSKIDMSAPGSGASSITGEEVARRVARFGDAELLTIADCGHIPHYEQPEALFEAVDTFI